MTDKSPDLLRKGRADRNGLIIRLNDESEFSGIIKFMNNQMKLLLKNTENNLPLYFTNDSKCLNS